MIQSSTTPDPGYQWESDKLTEDTTNESQEVSPFPAGDHEAHINRRAQNIANTRQNKNIKDPQKKSKARSIALASAMKIDESPGIRCILLWLSDITAQPTFESSFDPSV